MIEEYIVVRDEKGYFRLLKHNGINMYDHVEKIITAVDKEDAKKQFRSLGYNV